MNKKKKVAVFFLANQARTEHCTMNLLLAASSELYKFLIDSGYEVEVKEMEPDTDLTKLPQHCLVRLSSHMKMSWEKAGGIVEDKEGVAFYGDKVFFPASDGKITGETIVSLIRRVSSLLLHSR